MLIKVVQQNLISDLLHNFRPGGVFSIQYTDATLLFFKMT
jgi:hypothetical protein